jgi:hypothetical protein
MVPLTFAYSLGFAYFYINYESIQLQLQDPAGGLTDDEDPASVNGQPPGIPHGGIPNLLKGALPDEDQPMVELVANRHPLLAPHHRKGPGDPALYDSKGPALIDLPSDDPVVVVIADQHYLGLDRQACRVVELGGLA